MTKEQFLQQFHLRSYVKKTSPILSHDKLTAAAVLIPICYQHNELTILLTQRASHLRHHAGQISFPGGKVEQKDTDLIATAMRETEEEIGLTVNTEHIIGTLNCFQTLTGYEITPVVALIEKPKNYQIDKNEVAHIFHLPIQVILEQKNLIKINTSYRKKQHQVYFLQYNEHNIWGATAAILHELANFIHI